MAVQFLVLGAEASDGCPIVKHLPHSSLSNVRRTLETERGRKSPHYDTPGMCNQSNAVGCESRAD